MATATKRTAAAAPATANKPKGKATVPAVPKQNKPPAKASDNDLPAFMQGDQRKGSENISAEDIGTPRLKLMQGLSKELESYNGLRAGMFFHVAEEFIFEGPVLAVPIYYHKRYLLWRPLENGGGILARADDAVHWSPPNVKFDVQLDKKDGGAKVSWVTKNTVRESGLAEWGSQNPEDPGSSPAATLMYEYVLGFPDHPELAPAVLTFQRSSVKKARTGINDKLRLGNAPIFGRLFEFAAAPDVNSVGQKFFNIQPTPRGLLMDEDLYMQYKSLNEAFTEAGLQVRDEEDLQAEGSVDDSAATEGKY